MQSLFDGLEMPIHAVPYRHQREAFEFVMGLFGVLPSKRRSSGAALLMEMGTGKTLTTIGITGVLSNRRVLVVAPLSIVRVWEEEFQKFADFLYCLVVLSGNGSRKRDMLLLTGTVITNKVVDVFSQYKFVNPAIWC